MVVGDLWKRKPREEEKEQNKTDTEKRRKKSTPALVPFLYFALKKETNELSIQTNKQTNTQ